MPDSTKPQEKQWLWNVASHGDQPSPRPSHEGSRLESHHGVNSAWMEANFAGYNHDKASTILIPIENHNATRTEYNAWRGEIRTRQGAKSVDWTKVSNHEIAELYQRQFQVARVPSSEINRYYKHFHGYCEDLRPRQGVEKQEQLDSLLQRLSPNQIEQRQGTGNVDKSSRISGPALSEETRHKFDISDDAKVVSANQKDGIYSGKVIGAVDDKTLQKLTPSILVEHPAEKLAVHNVQTGRHYDINYSQGKVTRCQINERAERREIGRRGRGGR